ARTCIDSQTAERIKELLGEELDWAYLLQMAHWHAVMPLLSWHLNQICAEAVPKPTRTYLRDYFHQNMRRNLYLTGELLKILKLFGGNGIQAVPFKGPTLASIAYQNLGLRQYTDLDLLVQNHDVPKAKALLLSQGYQPSFHLTQAREMAYLAYQSEYGFTRTKDGVIIELHWGMAPKYFSFQFDSERLWSRLQRISIGGAEVLTLPAEVLF